MSAANGQPDADPNAAGAAKKPVKSAEGQAADKSTKVQTTGYADRLARRSKPDMNTQKGIRA